MGDKKKRKDKPARIPLYVTKEVKEGLIRRAAEETIRRQGQTVSVNALIGEWIEDRLGRKR